MKTLAFIPIKLTIALGIGILSGYYLNIKPGLALTSLLVSLSFSGMLLWKLRRKHLYVFGLVAGIAIVQLGILAVSIAKPQNHPCYYEHYTKNEKQLWELKIREILKENSFSYRYRAEVRAVDMIAVKGELELIFDKASDPQHLEVDQEFITWNKVNTVPLPKNPNQFNYSQYLKRMGVHHQMRFRDTGIYLKPESSHTLRGLAARIRDRVNSKLQQTNIRPAQLAIIKALLLGQRHEIESEVYDNYKKAGAVHILAVSGLHIGVLLLLLQFLLKPIEMLPRGRTISLCLAVVLLWGFAFLAGLSASVIRAVTMFSFLAYAFYLNRPANSFNIMALSMLFLLLVFSPMLLFQVGFQMSYAAVFSILWLYPKLQRVWKPKNSMLKKLWQLVSVSLAAQLGVLPISLYNFHQLPGLFLLSNLLIVPFLGLILGMGVVIIILSLLNILPSFLSRIYDYLIYGMNGIVENIATQKVFVFSDIPFDLFKLFLLYLIIIGLVSFIERPQFKRIFFPIAAVIFFQLWSLFLIISSHSKQELIIMQQTRQSVLFFKDGRKLDVHHSGQRVSPTLIRNYVLATHSKERAYFPLQNVYRYGNRHLLVLDSTAVRPDSFPKPFTMLLTQSPKVNLERIIEQLQPEQIIADGSNYRSFIERWEKTCSKMNLPFYSTAEQGAISLN